jgi:hypothetical protein
VNADLDRALTEPGLRPLPDRVVTLLAQVAAPPRLAAHLRAVHDVAVDIARWVGEHYPAAGVDAEAVAFGAATHDIGKTLHPAELSGPGAEHEPAGEALLLRHGVEARLARFARTHAAWDRADIGIDDLLVSLADKVWKGKRVPDLEDRVVELLAASSGSGEQAWEAFLRLDDLLDRIAADAEARLAFQAGHSL